MSKFQVQINLMLKDDEGKRKARRFKSAEWLDADVMDNALDVAEKLDSAEGREGVKEALQECYAFIANVIFEGQFTTEEYRNGIDAREIAQLTGKFLRSVTQGYDNTYADTKKKVTELLEKPNFVRTPKYREMELKLQLLESGWSLYEIERTDLDELMKLFAFRDAVNEREELEYFDEYTHF